MVRLRFNIGMHSLVIMNLSVNYCMFTMKDIVKCICQSSTSIHDFKLQVKFIIGILSSPLILILYITNKSNKLIVNFASFSFTLF